MAMEALLPGAQYGVIQCCLMSFSLRIIDWHMMIVECYGTARLSREPLVIDPPGASSLLCFKCML